MSNTEKTYGRFWATMSERYGNRWFEAYGEIPTHAWRETLSAFTPRDIQAAIDLLSTREHTRQHPPTEPEFKALLTQATKAGAKAVENPAANRRGYWRSSIVFAVSDALGYRYQGVGDEFETVLIANKSLGAAMRDLLNEVDELEVSTGQRTPGQEAMVERRCREIAAAFRQLKRAA